MMQEMNSTGGMSGYDQLISKLDGFIRKYYLNKTIRGSLYWVGLVLSLLLAYSILEHYFYFSEGVRKFMFFSYIGVALLSFAAWIGIPVMKILKQGKVISHEQAAEIIGQHFQDVSDKLLNVLQLKEQQNSAISQALAFASIEQKTEEIKLVPFRNAIDLKQNRKYLRWALPPMILIISLLVAAPSMITDSTNRIIKNNTTFEREAPFSFILPAEDELVAEQYKDFLLDVNIEGSSIPDEVFIEVDGYQFRLKKEESTRFTYKFKNVHQDTEFKLFAASVESRPYTLGVLRKPSLIDFKIALDYPAYTQRRDNTLDGVGDIVVPEGTVVNWEFEASNTETLRIRLGENDKAESERRGSELFTYQTTASNDQTYAIFLENNDIAQLDSVMYTINVVPDAYPKISVEQFEDSLDQKLVYFAGTAGDDYGLRKLTFNVQIVDIDGSANDVESYPLSIGRKSQEQFSYGFDFNEIILEPGQTIQYYFEVFDNDAVNGSKSTKSKVRAIRKMTLEEYEAKTAENSDKIKQDLKKSLEESKKIEKDVKKLREELLQEKDMNWQNKKELDKVMERRQNLQNQLNDIQQMFEENKQNQEELTQPNEEQQEKMEQMQELFEDLMTEEIQEMLEKLQEMMDEMEQKDALEMLENMAMDEEELQKELDRLMELFKKLEMEQEMQKQIDKLNELAEKEEELSEKTENQTESNEQLQKEQEEIQKELKDVQEKQKELEKKNEELEKPKNLQDSSEEMEKAQQDMENSQEQLEKKENKKASESQKNAAERMKQMAQQMQGEMMQGEMEQMQEDMSSLRQLLENLVTLSFDQEDNINRLAKTRVNTPRYVSLVQDQFKIQDDFKVVEDSLHALSKRIMQIESYVTETVTDVKGNLKSSVDFLEERNKTVASDHQQRVMTGMNDLALMLSEVMNQMQQQMSMMMPGNQMCDNPQQQGQGENSGSVPMDKITQGQKDLNKDMKGMKEGMKKGEKGSSEQFARMAARQAALRKALRELAKEKEQRGNRDQGLEEAIEQMDKIETDLVNKRLTNEMIKRQREILTRLLEAEKAEQQREMDEKRQGESAQQIERILPPEIDEYLKEREAEIESFQTVSPSLRPYYKFLVEEYYDALKRQ